VALIPENERHRLQIAAGTLGRDRGHQFEKDLASAISKLSLVHTDFENHENKNRVIGNPAIEIVKYIAFDLGLSKIDNIQAYWLGGLATSGLGDLIHAPDGSKISRSKTDVLISIKNMSNVYTKGISVKTCNSNKPTNDQLYFTTASAFSNLLRRNKVPISDDAEIALRMFCGDEGYRPMDKIDTSSRLSDPERWFFEELPDKGRKELIYMFTDYQADITHILLKLAYLDDPHPPDYLLHLAVQVENIDKADLAIFSIEELIYFSNNYGGFSTKEYQIRKGRFKDDPNTHLAPRFGFIQFQRGGQKQHPTQLQFNLMAGYFNHLDEK